MNKNARDTQRFYLKPLTFKHVKYITQWYEDIEDLAMIESKLPVPINSSSLKKIWERDLAQTEPRTCYLFAICDEENETIGFTGLQDINYAYGNSVVFIYVKESARRSGIALRTVALMLELAFHQLRMHRVSTYVFAHNKPSIELIKRCGFSDEGVMREACYYDGSYSDVKIVGILAAEWQDKRHGLSDELESNISVAFGRKAATRWCWPLQ